MTKAAKIKKGKEREKEGYNLEGKVVGNGKSLDGEGNVAIFIKPSVRKRLRKYKIERNAKNYSDALGEILEKLEG
jgi:hypothetical protein